MFCILFTKFCLQNNYNDIYQVLKYCFSFILQISLIFLWSTAIFMLMGLCDCLLTCFLNNACFWSYWIFSKWTTKFLFLYFCQSWANIENVTEPQIVCSRCHLVHSTDIKPIHSLHNSSWWPYKEVDMNLCFYGLYIAFLMHHCITFCWTVGIFSRTFVKI